MRFLANENVAKDLVVALRAGGHDTAWVRQDAPGSPDTDVLARARNEARILITFDKDFGELAFHAKLPSESGVILFRMRMPKATEVGARLAKLVTARDDWAGHFSVVEPGRVRMRRLPKP
jgi:predicted nuclease of predicted toxin-antitoxin system